jgi:hypothetical protein
MLAKVSYPKQTYYIEKDREERNKEYEKNQSC